ncbi:hypothetical protein [Actinoallomurus sp. NPDC050550]|uniref:hypothetical protein n=1 Tax=Actinoallomurus sp. NPDC050550 TaxID=3154937 RepID=UPI0033C749C7
MPVTLPSASHLPVNGRRIAVDIASPPAPFSRVAAFGIGAWMIGYWVGQGWAGR